MGERLTRAGAPCGYAGFEGRLDCRGPACGGNICCIGTAPYCRGSGAYAWCMLAIDTALGMRGEARGEARRPASGEVGSGCGGSSEPLRGMAGRGEATC